MPWGENAVSYDSNGAKKCLEYFHKIFEGLEQAKCDVFRLHLDPCWTNDPNKQATGDGSEANPFRTIQKGVDWVSDGRKVWVK